MKLSLHLIALVCCPGVAKETSAFFLRFEGGWWSLPAWICALRKALVYLVSSNRSTKSNKNQVRDPRWQEIICLGSCDLPTFFISEHSRGLSKGRALPECQGARQDLEQLWCWAVWASPPTWDIHVFCMHAMYPVCMLAMWVVFLSCLAHCTKNFLTLWVNTLLLTLKCLCCLALSWKHCWRYGLFGPSVPAVSFSPRTCWQQFGRILCCAGEDKSSLLIAWTL